MSTRPLVSAQARMFQRAAHRQRAAVGLGLHVAHRHFVLRQQERAGEIGDRQAGRRHAQLAALQIDAAVEQRRRRSAGDTGFEHRLAAGRHLRKKRAQRAEIDRPVHRDVERLDAFELDAAAQRETVAGAAPVPRRDLRASAGDIDARRLLLGEGHAGDREVGAIEHELTAHGRKRRTIGVEHRACPTRGRPAAPSSPPARTAPARPASPNRSAPATGRSSGRDADLR